MTTPDPAATLRAAAARLRALAAEATPGPWTLSTQVPAVFQGPDDPPRLLAAGHLGDAAWIATLGPQCAEPLAAWLEYAAERMSIYDEEYPPDGNSGWFALNLARAVLGDAPVDGEGGAP